MLSVAEFLVVFHKAVTWLISYLQTLQNSPAAFLLHWTVWIFLQEYRLGLLLLLLLLLCLFQPFSLFLLFASQGCHKLCLLMPFLASPLPSSPGL